MPRSGALDVDVHAQARQWKFSERAVLRDVHPFAATLIPVTLSLTRSTRPLTVSTFLVAIRQPPRGSWRRLGPCAGSRGRVQAQPVQGMRSQRRPTRASKVFGASTT